MRFTSLILLLFVMLMCTAPALEKDMCALRGSECQCEGTCGDDYGCDCCSPFIACSTCTGFEAVRRVKVVEPVVCCHAVMEYAPTARIQEAFISVDTPPPLYC